MDSAKRQIIVDMSQCIGQAPETARRRAAALRSGQPSGWPLPLQRRVSAVAGSPPTMGRGWTSTKGIVMLLRWLAALLFVGGLAAGLGAGMTAPPSLISAEES